jgi:alkylhydroperoxidase family enzyme
MRLTEPRLPPLADDELNQAQEDVLAGFRASNRDYNIFRTFARDPAAFKAFLVWGGHVLSNDNPLGARRREIAILRTGFLCKAGYEWARHVPIARHAGMSEAEIAAIKAGVGDAVWDQADRALLAATDALVSDHFIDDAGWHALCAHFTEAQRLALIFTVGQYAMVAMFLNSVGVQLDADVALDEDLVRMA